MRRICTICARGGSKGVKGKNVRLLVGAPLITHSIDQARASGLFESIAVSSDSDEILQIAKDWGIEILVKRPDELATDKAAKLPVIRHCVAEVERRRGIEFDLIVDLDATSPLRLSQDIVVAVSMVEESNCENLITGTESRRSPYFNLVELDPSGKVHLSKPLATSIERRQDAPKCFDMNASIYVWRRSALFESDSLFNATTKLYVMPEERSVDIDSELDFKFVEFLLMQRKLDDVTLDA